MTLSEERLSEERRRTGSLPALRARRQAALLTERDTALYWARIAHS